MPLVVGWFNGQPVLYLSPEASDPGAGGPQANFSSLLGRSANTNAVVPIFIVTNFKPGNIIASAPLPTGPASTSMAYSPLWQVVTVTWKQGMTPSLLTSSDDVQAALAAGKGDHEQDQHRGELSRHLYALGMLPGVTATSNEEGDTSED
jgi:hypothetical protein